MGVCVCVPGSWRIKPVPEVCTFYDQDMDPDAVDLELCITCQHDKGCHEDYKEVSE